MSIVLLLLTAVIFCLLVIVTAVRPSRPTLSMYELKRRADDGDLRAREILYKNELLDDVESIMRVKSSLLLAVTVVLLIITFGWVLGCVLAVVVVLEYGAIARLAFVSRIAASLYTAIEPIVLRLVTRMAAIMPFIRSTIRTDATIRLGSSQELAHLVDTSDGVLSESEKKVIVHSLSFSNKVVGDVMTKVDDVITVKKTEFLGPLTLDELHRSGHSRLPVIGADTDSIVGILRLQNLLALDIKRSVTAEKAMDSHVMYVNKDQTLPHMLAAMLRTHQHLFIVINKDRTTAGLVTLNDVIEALIGHKIIDEFDDHESVRAVSERTSHKTHDQA